jgi:hypothetical protein
MNPSDFRRIKRESTIGGERDWSPSTNLKVSSVVGAFAGWGIGAYSGIFLLIPLVCTAVVFFIAWKLLPKDRRIIVPSLSVQAGHLLWFVIGMLVTRTMGANIIDVAWLLAGLIWLVARPGRGPIWLLGIFQLLSLASNGYLFAHAAVGTTAHKALLVHIIWRLLALLLMGKLYMQLRRQEFDRRAESFPPSS